MNPAFQDIRDSLGLGPVVSDWTYDEGVAYRRAVAAYIQAHPDEFSSGQNSVANQEANYIDSGNSGLVDDSFSITDFVKGVGDNALNALDDVGQVGKGVLSGFRLTSWLIPLSLIIVVGILLFAFYKKRTA